MPPSATTPCSTLCLLRTCPSSKRPCRYVAATLAPLMHALLISASLPHLLVVCVVSVPIHATVPQDHDRDFAVFYSRVADMLAERL